MTGHTVPESMRRLWGIPESNDLPPLWDGEPVTWKGWSDLQTSAAYHAPLDQLACRNCGGLQESLINWGTRKVTQPGPSWGRQIRDIWAARCRDCGHDVVHDQRTSDTWDLGPEDYGDTGSAHPDADTIF